MLTQPTPKALEALYGISRHPRWADVQAMIEAEIQSGVSRLLAAQDLRQIGEAQGRVKTLQEFLLTVREAGETLERLGKQPGL